MGNSVDSNVLLAEMFNCIFEQERKAIDSLLRKHHGKKKKKPTKRKP